MPVVDIHNTLGAAFIGFLVSTVFFGLTIGQTWIYYWYYWTKDTKALKLFIALLTVLDTSVTIVTAYSLYWYLVLNSGNAEAINKWALTVQANLSATSASAVQLFYARRIYLLSRSIFLPLIIVILCVIGNVIGFYVSAKQFATQVTSRYRTLIVFGYWGMGQTIVVDVLITSMLSWALYRKKTGIARTDSLIKTLMAYTINTGLLTAVLATAMTISFIVLPSSLIPEAIFWTANKCYVNAVLAMLNSRDHIRGNQSTTYVSDSSFNLTPIRINEAHRSKSRRQEDTNDIVHCSIISDRARDNSDDYVGHTFEDPKLQNRISESCA